MTGLNPARNFLTACATMVLGSFLIFGAVVMINELASGPEAQQGRAEKGFEIVKQQEPKPKQVVKREPRKREPERVAPPNPLDGLDTSLSGIALDLPGFSMDSLNSLQGDVLGDTRDVVMTGEAVDVPPRPTRRGAMSYPVTAKAEGIEGYVILSVLISATGEVEDVKVLESQPGDTFEQVAVRGVRDWKFQPAQYQGKQVRVWAKQKIRFDLS